MNKKVLILIICIVIVVAGGLGVGGYYSFKYFKNIKTQPKNPPYSTPNNIINQPQQSYAYTLVAYKGQVFGAKVPQGWKVTDNESGIEIVDPNDSNTGVSGIVAVGWFGYQTPDSFINFMLNAVGAKDVKYENTSDEGTIPISNLKWVMKTKTFTFTNKSGVTIKAKASAGIINGYGQYVGMLTAFQTTPDKWSRWAPTLERIAKSIMIINPSKAGGIDKVRLPTAADLKNDSSPIMESWEYRNKVGGWSSHEWGDAIMGQESDLVSLSTGRSYTQPLNNYDPSAGGYHNPDNYSEILIDSYAK